MPQKLLGMMESNSAKNDFLDDVKFPIEESLLQEENSRKDGESTQWLFYCCIHCKQKEFITDRGRCPKRRRAKHFSNPMTLT